MAMYSETGADLVRDGRGHRLRVLGVTSGYFSTLRSGLAYGAGFDRADESGTRRIVLSDAVWRTHFGGDPAVVGRTIHLSAEPYEVVGIAPRTFTDPILGKPAGAPDVAGDVDVWTPYNLAGDTFEENYSLTAIGRLRDGVSVEQGARSSTALRGPMKERWPSARRSEIVAVPLQEDLVAPSRGPLHLLLIAVALVLLIASVNVANLVLMRATGRTQEFAIRSALGSGRGRLARQTLVESLLLAGLGGALGLLLARNGVMVLQRLGREALPRLGEIGFDPIVLGFALLTTVATAVACGVVPAVRLARTAPVEALRQQSRSATGTRGQARLRSGLAIAQLALALTLLVGAGVLMATVHRLQRVDLGFRVDRILTFEVNLPTARYSAPRRAAFHEELARAVRAIPGVTAVGSISRLPATGSYHPWGTRIVTRPQRRHDDLLEQGLHHSTADDQRGAVGRARHSDPGRPLVRRPRPGRRAGARGGQRQLRPAAFPGLPLDAVIGQRIAPLGRAMEIVGVAGDVALDVYGKKALTVYHAHAQFAFNRNWALTQVVAADLPPEQMLEPVRAAVAGLDAITTIEPVDSPAALEAAGVEVIKGALTFRSPGVAEVDGRTIRFRQALIATGAAPVNTGIPGLDPGGAVTSDTIWEVDALPVRLAIVGGGPIACELGQAFARLGSKVTMIVRSRILPKEDPDAADLLRESLAADGVRILENTTVQKAVGTGPGSRLLLRDGAAVKADTVLLATGRSPRTEGLGLERVGVSWTRTAR